jgi:hypothetical protein
VLNTHDSGPGSLRAEVAAAKQSDTIVFDPGLDGRTIGLTGGEIDINKSITIQGPGAGLLTISGENLSRVFFVKARQDVVLSGMMLTGGNGVAGEPGFNNVDANGFGGAIADLGNLTLNHCTVTGNSASVEGGGVAAGFKNGNFVSSLTLNNCMISGNTAEDGGGVLAVTSVTINNSTVSGNSARAFGGGIVLDRSTSVLVVSGSTVSGNSAGVSGGGIDNSGGGSLTVSTTSFCGNTPNDINGSYTDGGGNTFC